MTDVKKLLEELQSEENINLKKIYFKILSNWHWFLILGSIGVLIGLCVSKFTSPTYKLSAMVLYKGETPSTGINFEDKIFNNKSNIQNELLTFQSNTLHYQALKNLGMNVSWYKKDIFSNIPLYKNEPFIIKPINGKYNLKGVPITITPISQETYAISVKQNVNFDGIENLVEFKDTIRYGLPFTNGYFNFIINKRSKTTYLNTNSLDPSWKNIFGLLNIKNSYVFTFNDLESLANLYENNTSVFLPNEDANGIQLTVTDGNAERAKDYLNELIKVYLNFNLKQKNLPTENTVRFIDSQLSQVLDSLDTAGKNFTDFRSKNGIINMSDKGNMIIDKLKELESQKETVKQKIEYFENLKDYIGSAEKANLIVAPSVIGISDVTLNAQLVRLNDLYTKKAIAKEKNPRTVIIDQEINNTLNFLGENIKNRLANSRSELKSLDSRISDINMELAGMPHTEQKLINIKRTFDLNNDLYTFLLQKRAEAAITNASNVPDAYILDPAKIKNTQLIGPKTKINCIIGLIAGLFIPFLFIIISDYLNEKIESIHDIEKLTNLPIVGEIPHNRYKIYNPVLAYPTSNISECYRSATLNISYITKSNKPQVIGLHSMFPEEGKSFNALNLALSFALDGKKVLLVGCDLRKPQLHKYFNCDHTKGLSTFLTNQNSIQEIITLTDNPNLNYVDSGPVTPNPQRLFNNDDFRNFMKNINMFYDYIILDNAPISLVSDAYYTAKYATTNIFVLRQGKSNKNQTKFIHKISEEKKLLNVAILLNDTVSKRYLPDGYKYKKYSYYEEDKQKKSFNLFKRKEKKITI